MQFTTEHRASPEGILWTATGFAANGTVESRKSGLAASMSDAITKAAAAIHSMRQAELSHWEQA